MLLWWIDGVLCHTELFSFMWSCLLIVAFSACAIGVCAQSLFLASEFKDIPYFLFFQIHCICLMLMSLVHLELSFIQVNESWYICILLFVWGISRVCSSFLVATILAFVTSSKLGISYLAEVSLLNWFSSHCECVKKKNLLVWQAGSKHPEACQRSKACPQLEQLWCSCMSQRDDKERERE